VLYAGAIAEDLAPVAQALGGGSPTVLPVVESERRTLVVTRKIASTPARFPRRPGIARKRPL
jgi:16S rRNA (guanine527-N7)-methyltransferase